MVFRPLASKEAGLLASQRSAMRRLRWAVSDGRKPGRVWGRGFSSSMTEPGLSRRDGELPHTELGMS